MPLDPIPIVKDHVGQSGLTGWPSLLLEDAPGTHPNRLSEFVPTSALNKGRFCPQAAKPLNYRFLPASSRGPKKIFASCPEAAEADDHPSAPGKPNYISAFP